MEKIAWEIKYFVDINDIVSKLNDKHQKEMEEKVNNEYLKKVAEGMGMVVLEAMKPRMLEEMRVIMLEECKQNGESSPNHLHASKQCYSMFSKSSFSTYWVFLEFSITPMDVSKEPCTMLLGRRFKI